MTTEAIETAAVTIEYVEGDAALHHHYRGQTSPQPVYVTLDCDAAKLSADWSGIIGAGCPMPVWHRRWVRWQIPALTTEAANALLDEIAPLCERIVEGYSCEWDGSNHVGRYTDDAEEAIGDILSLIGGRSFEGEVIEVWDAGDWYGGIGSHDAQRSAVGITAETTDDELAAIIEREEAEAAPRIIEGAARYLTDLRDRAREESDDE